MGYLKWLVLDKHREFYESGDSAAFFFGSLVMLTIITLFATLVGIFLFAMFLIFWGIPIFFFAQEAFRKSLKEYEDDKKE